MSSPTQWILNDWHTLMPAPLANVLLCCTAALCGVIVGAERERKEKPTGPRTLALVSLGACVFTLLSGQLGIHDVHIAANIISGIGFLGAGIIIHGRYGVAGLTSAATIWTMAAVGMTSGSGHPVAALALSLCVLFTLSGFGKLEKRYIDPCKFAVVHLTYQPAGGKTLIKLEGLLDEFGAPGTQITTQQEADGLGSASIRYCFLHLHHREILARFAEMPEVQTISRDALPKSGQA
jgi:putative Mg2+ transporter-C (MgtC) family protein